MDGIVYTSNTGFTAEYAKLLGEQTGLSVYTLAEARAKLPAGSKVIYMGWLMASGVKDYKKAAARYGVQAVCGVGMGATGTQVEEVKKANGITDIPVFVLQGGFDMSRLRGVYKFMMTLMAKTAGKALAEKQDKTPEEADMLDLMQNGGSRVSLENLSAVLDWYRG